VHLDGPAGLGHAALHTTPDSSAAPQPLGDEAGLHWMTFDGRLDNRDEILHALDAPVDRAAADARLVLAAYARWGERAIERLIGDFAFALWDAPNRRLVCARDALGIRPFYYRLEDDVFWCASELQALLALEGMRARVRPNEGFLGEHVAARPVQLEETVFSGILRLPAAHLLIVEPSRARKRRYWEPAALDLSCRTDGEYAERFLDVLDRAVACRLRAPAPVGAHLSGGLDSSSVVALAASRPAADLAPPLETLSLEFPGKPYDEREYIDAMIAHAGVRAHLLRGGDLDPGLLTASADRSRDLPDAPTGEAMLQPLVDAARARGIRVILTGVGGDEWLQGSEFYYADLIRRGQWGTLVRLLRAAPAGSPVDRTLRLVLAAGVRPLLPLVARRAVRRLLGRTLVPAWIEPSFARRVGLDDRLRPPDPSPWRGSYARADVRRQLESGWEALMKEQLERGAAACGVEYRHPFYDRRLVEFALALPEEQRQRADVGKVVLRRALAGRLPDAVRRRTSKVHYSALYFEALEALGGEACFSNMAIAGLGWVRGDRVRRLYRAAAESARAGDTRYEVQMISLWAIWSVERWVRANMGHNGGAPWG